MKDFFKMIESFGAAAKDIYPQKLFEDGAPERWAKSEKEHLKELKEIPNNSLEYALKLIVQYDCWYEWLKEIIDDMEEINKKKNVSEYESYMPELEWHTERHVIWMLLVGMFGDWGTSIRGGWIPKYKFDDCIAFIKTLLPEDEEEE
jgi:hypothetical protein